MQIIVIGGPNGSGKSTSAPFLVAPNIPFLNADVIAAEIRASTSGNVDLVAGRMLLEQMEQLEHQGLSFAVETTLASRSLAPRIARLQEKGYLFELHYVWQPNPEICISRVAQRVREGGHFIPEETVRRRYTAGLKNFSHLYRPMADSWQVLQNASVGKPYMVAKGAKVSITEVYNADLWNLILERATP